MANWQDDFELASNYTDDSLAAQAKGTAEDAVTAAAEAAETAKTAQAAAGEAKTTAEIAHETATAADDKAATAKQTAEDATSAASAASTTAAAADKKAEQAVDTASTAQTTADAADTKAIAADTRATEAATAAAAADTKATQAVTDAAAAKTTANGAASTASTAKTTAEGAVSTATAAKTTAEDAVSTASTAITTADAAKTTATTAKTTAETAKATADTANTTATAADTKAEEAKVIAEAAIQSVDVEYALGSLATAAPTSGWTTTAPVWESGKYMWQRTKTTTSSGSTYSDPTCISGAKGDTGVAGKGVRSTTITYQASMSGTNAPTGTWSTSIPSVSASQYLWTRTVTTYTDSTTSTAYSVGMMGAQGVSCSKIVEQYYLSTSSSSQVGGSWSTTCPTWVNGKYIWTRSQVTWSNSTITYTTPVLANALNSANSTAASASATASAAATTANTAKSTAETAQATAEATANYFMADSSGAYVASVEGNHDSGKNLKLSADGLTLRNNTADIASFMADRVSLASNCLVIDVGATGGVRLEAINQTLNNAGIGLQVAPQFDFVADGGVTIEGGESYIVLNDGMTIRKDGVGNVASFGDAEIKLGSDNAKINFLEGAGFIEATQDENDNRGLSVQLDAQNGVGETSTGSFYTFGTSAGVRTATMIESGTKYTDVSLESDRILMSVFETNSGLGSVTGMNLAMLQDDIVVKDFNTGSSVSLVPKSCRWDYYGFLFTASVFGGFCTITGEGLASTRINIWSDMTPDSVKTWLAANAPLGTKSFCTGYSPNTNYALYFQLGSAYQLWIENCGFNAGEQMQMSLTYPTFYVP